MIKGLFTFPCFPTCYFLWFLLCRSSKTHISLVKFNNAFHQLYLPSHTYASGQAGQEEGSSAVTSTVMTPSIFSDNDFQDKRNLIILEIIPLRFIWKYQRIQSSESTTHNITTAVACSLTNIQLNYVSKCHNTITPPRFDQLPKGLTFSLSLPVPTWLLPSHPCSPSCLLQLIGSSGLGQQGTHTADYWTNSSSMLR